MSIMEKQVLGYESPLYGRRTAQFKIEAIANGASKFNTIATKTQIAPSSLDANLTDLIELGIIKKKKPMGNSGKFEIVKKDRTLEALKFQRSFGCGDRT